MRKPRTQPAFATLTPAEIDQIADWLRHDTYDVVLDRIRKPRSEGGFGLSISTSPLERLYKRTNIVDKINARLATGQKLTVSALDAINAAEAPASEEVHDAIMSATYELATSGDNTPTQLLALQRLADFPARAQIREERLELDHQKFVHKQEMDAFRKQIAEQRLALAKEKFTFHQKQHEDRLALAREKAQSNHSRLTTNHSPKSDHLGRFATDWKGVGERVCKQFNISPEEEARRAELHKTWKQPHVRPGVPTEINPVDD